MLIDQIDLDRFLNTRGVQSPAGFIALCFKHELKRVAQIPSALIQGVSLCDRAGDFFDPAHEPSRALWLNDGVEVLLHQQTIEQTAPCASIEAICAAHFLCNSGP